MPDLLVYVNGAQAGEIRIDGGSTFFQYADSYRSNPNATPLSLSLPLYTDIPMPVDAWLDGLLPDNKEARAEWRARNNVRDTHTTALLASPAGLDCAGAVQFCAHGNESTLIRDSELNTKTEAQIADWIAAAREHWPVRAHLDSKLPFSLGGAHAKYALHYDSGVWSVPHGDIPTTHILKTGMLRFQDSDVLEHVCLRAAQLIGLNAAVTRLQRFEGQRALVVDRFDRFEKEGRILRLHHEDLCQAFGVPPVEKYQNKNGPSPTDIARLLSLRSDNPVADKRRFRDALIYNWAILAPDAHAKNYSLMLDSGNVRLAPLYDVISALPYYEQKIWEDVPLAMTVAENFEVRYMDDPDSWKKLTETLELDKQETFTRISELVAAVPDAFTTAVSELDFEEQILPVVGALHQGVQKRCETLGAVFGDVLKSKTKKERSGKQRKPPSPQTSAPPPPRMVICGQPLPKQRGVCQRKLTSTVCPFHPQSSGSQAIRRR